MRWSFGIGRIAGIRIYVHVTFLIFVAWMALDKGVTSGDPRRALSMAVFLLLVFACVTLHELGHALMAGRFGIRTKSIVLLPIGGVAQLERIPEKPSQELAVAVAGPAVNVLIAIALLFVLAARGTSVASASLDGGLLTQLLVVNVAMVVFNLIPAFPMDGGRVLRALLATRMPFAKATRVASIVGQIAALGFGLIGLLGKPTNPFLVFIGLFVFLAAGEERAVVESRSSLSGIPVRDAMLTDFFTLDIDETLQRAVDYLMAGSQADFPVLESGVPVGTLGRNDLVLALQREGTTARVGDVMRTDPAAAAPGEPLENVLHRMRERGRVALPVLDNGRVIGLVTLENISDLLVVNAALKRHAGAA